MKTTKKYNNALNNQQNKLYLSNQNNKNGRDN